MMDIDPSEPTPALILANTQVHWLRGTATPINTQCNSTDHLASTGTHAGHTLSPNSALQECGDPLYQYLISLSQSMPSVRAASVHGHLLQCTFKSISTKFKATLGLFRFCSHFQSFFKKWFSFFPISIFCIPCPFFSASLQNVIIHTKSDANCHHTPDLQETHGMFNYGSGDIFLSDF